MFYILLQVLENFVTVLLSEAGPTDCPMSVTNMAPFMPFRVILVIEWQHNNWTNIIVNMTILSFLGSSDDKEKEKIGIARPEVLISNGTPMLSRFWIGKSRTSGVHSSPIVRSGSGSAVPWWSGASFGLVGGVAWGEYDESTSSTFGSTSSSFLDRASHLLCL